MTVRGWYARHGRHSLAWRHLREPWPVLVSEVMLHQTQVRRVAAVWPEFIARFATPEATAAAGPGAVIAAWGRLGYPRRARRLWEAAAVIAERGWPDDLTRLPGVGRYTARAVATLAHDVDVPAVEVNVRRVAQRCAGRGLTEREAEVLTVELGRPLRARDRLLALMDLGALVCRPRRPRCGECPLRTRCASHGPLEGETASSQPRYEGSFRQRRGRVLAALRNGPHDLGALDGEALASLVVDGLAVTDDRMARLP